MLGRVDDLKVVSCRRHVSHLERVAHPAGLGLVLGNLVPKDLTGTVTIQLPDMSGIRMVKSSLIAEWSAI